MKQLIFRFIVAGLTAFFIYSCGTEKKSSDILNPNDTTSTAFVPPQTIFVSAPITGNTISTSSIRVSWRGSKDVQAFSYTLDNSAWTPFSVDTFLVIDDLDEGSHFFSVRSKHANGTIETSPSVINFIVDAVKGPAIMFEKRQKEVSVGQNFTYTINIEEVQNILGLKATLLFDKQFVTISSVDLASYATSNNVKPTFFEGVDNITGSVRLDVLFSGGSPKKGIAGSGGVLVLNCNAKAVGTSNIIFNQDSTWYRDTTNTTVLIKGFVAGKLIIK